MASRREEADMTAAKIKKLESKLAAATQRRIAAESALADFYARRASKVRQ
jgi:hypothetical protein